MKKRVQERFRGPGSCNSSVEPEVGRTNFDPSTAVGNMQMNFDLTVPRERIAGTLGRLKQSRYYNQVAFVYPSIEIKPGTLLGKGCESLTTKLYLSMQQRASAGKAAVVSLCNQCG